MRYLLIILCLPFIGLSQNIDKYNLDIARELGECYDKVVVDKETEISYPLCSDSTVRVFFLEPNYYAVYNESLGWCGSAGCSVSFYKRENNKYVEIPSSVLIGAIDITQDINNYIVFSDLVKRDHCWTYYTVKIKMKNDVVYFEELVKYDHQILDKEHSIYCESNTTSFLHIAKPHRQHE